MNTNNNQQYTQPTSNNKNKLRLCGAAKKRYQHLLKRGLPEDVARLQALKPIHPARRQTIRGNNVTTSTSTRSSGSWRVEAAPIATSPASTLPQIERLPVQARLGAPVNRVPAAPVVKPPVIDAEDGEDCNKQCLNLAILPGDYPSELWSIPQLEAVQQSIIDLIRRQSADTIKPKFSGCAFRQGWLSVSCNDSYTVKWMRAMDTRLRPWEGASLQVIPESDVPFKRIFVGIFPALQTSSVKYALRLIDEQNEGLTVPDWRMLYRGQAGPHMKLIISIDSHSAEILRKRDYHLNYGFSSVRFRPMEMAK